MRIVTYLDSGEEVLFGEKTPIERFFAEHPEGPYQATCRFRDGHKLYRTVQTPAPRMQLARVRYSPLALTPQGQFEAEPIYTTVTFRVMGVEEDRLIYEEE